MLKSYGNDTDQYQIILQRLEPDSLLALPPNVCVLGEAKLIDTASTRAAAYIKLLKLAARMKKKPVMGDTPDMIRQKVKERQERARLQRLVLLDDE